MNRQLAGFRQFDTEQDRHGLLLESAPDADQGQIDNTAGHPRAGPGQSGEQQRVVGQCLDRQALWIDYLEDHLPRIDDLTHDGVGGADDTVNRRHQRFTAEAAAERAFSLLEGGEFDLRLLDILLRNAAFELPDPWPSTSTSALRTSKRGASRTSVGCAAAPWSWPSWAMTGADRENSASRLAATQAAAEVGRKNGRGTA